MFFVYISADGCVIVLFFCLYKSKWVCYIMCSMFILVQMDVLCYVFFVYISVDVCVIVCVLCLY